MQLSFTRGKDFYIAIYILTTTAEIKKKLQNSEYLGR